MKDGSIKAKLVKEITDEFEKLIKAKKEGQIQDYYSFEGARNENNKV